MPVSVCSVVTRTALAAILLTSLTGCIVIDDYAASKEIYAGRQLEKRQRLTQANESFERAAELAQDSTVETTARKALADNLMKRGRFRQAMNERENLVALGDRKSLATVARAMTKQNYRPRDIVAMAKALESEADRGSVTAALALGDLLDSSDLPEGTIKEQDPEIWYQKASDGGSTSAKRRLVDLAAKRGNERAVANYARLDGRRPLADTYKRLAKSFDEGTNGFARNKVRADRYWQLAGGRPIAKLKPSKLAKAPRKPKDEILVAAKALPRAKSGAERARLVAVLDGAASRGNGRAAFALARHYTPQDGRPGEQALKYYAIAAANGERRAVDEVITGTVSQKGDGELSQSMLASLEKAANGGSAEAALGLAQLYLNGGAVPTDNAKGTVWLRKAAELGSIDAQFRLGVMLTGMEDPTSKTEGSRWLESAARKGSKSASAYLASLNAR
jgi:TPR repeat protein